MWNVIEVTQKLIWAKRRSFHLQGARAEQDDSLTNVAFTLKWLKQVMSSLDMSS